jgi:hypothetical protein
VKKGVEYERTESYAASKLMNVLFTKEIARYFETKLQQNVSHKASETVTKNLSKTSRLESKYSSLGAVCDVLAWFLFRNIQFNLLRRFFGEHAVNM